MTGVRADVSDLAGLDDLYVQIRAQYGTLDIVVANAGVGAGGGLGEITEEAFDSVFGTNVKGVVFTVQKALPLLADPASVILIGSTTSLRPGPGMTLYAASKAASPPPSRSAGSPIRTRSPGPRSSSPPASPASSTAPSCSPTAARPRSDSRRR